MSGRDKRRPPLANRINDLIATLAPRVALRREMALAQRRALATMSGHYDGAGRTSRASDFRFNRTDAIEAGRADRSRLSWMSRDMLRNNPRTVRGRRQLVNHVVGAGIIPSVHALDDDEEVRTRVEAVIRQHGSARHWDVDGRLSLLGQQALGFGTIVSDGEVLFRRRYRRPSDGHPLNFQVQVLEADFLNEMIDGKLPNGNTAVQGIEFDGIGRRVAYHIYAQHPGSRWGAMPPTKRVAAENIIHAFDPVRPGQQRGVSWFAPVVTLLHELQKYQDGQVKRQEIAAMFAAVWKTADQPQEIGELQPGSVLNIGQDDEITWTDPPTVEGYDPFMRVTDRTIAAALGLTYDQFTGDTSQSNYTSHRAGRMATDPNIKDWQQNLMIAQVCDGFARWIEEGLQDVEGIDPDAYEIRWTPPARPVVDPTKDVNADKAEIEAGLASRREKIRERGKDPKKVEAEIAEERRAARNAGVGYSTDQNDPPPDEDDEKEGN
ncbi:MAG: phage portal protein [Pseudomonadota bacterium]|nr:phage portal protein [Pseudomonadota bacterium]